LTSSRRYGRLIYNYKRKLFLRQDYQCCSKCGVAFTVSSIMYHAMEDFPKRYEILYTREAYIVVLLAALRQGIFKLKKSI